MNKERFTPGEWEADCTRVMVGDKLLVEQNWWDLPNEFDEAQKNASLISAAPEMYELLDMIRKAVSFDAGILGSCLSKIDPLLKKARGEKCLFVVL